MAYGFSCSRVEFEDMDTNVDDPAIITGFANKKLQ